MISKLCCTCKNHVPIAKKNKEQKQKQKQKKNNKKKKTKKTTTKQTKRTLTYNSPCLHHSWKCYQAIALNDQQVGSTSLALLSP